MANALNNQASFAHPLEQNSGHYFWLKNETPQTGLRNPWNGASGASQGDAIMISDDESEFGDLEDGASDTSFPPPHELGQPVRCDGQQSETSRGDGIIVSDDESDDSSSEPEDLNESVAFRKQMKAFNSLYKPVRREDAHGGAGESMLLESFIYSIVWANKFKQADQILNLATS